MNDDKIINYITAGVVIFFISTGMMTFGALNQLYEFIQ
jgi:hypothetical protein